MGPVLLLLGWVDGAAGVFVPAGKGSLRAAVVAGREGRRRPGPLCPVRLTRRVAVSPQMRAELLLLPYRAGLRLLPPLRLRHRAPGTMKLQSPQFQALFTPGLRSLAGEYGPAGGTGFPGQGRGPGSCCGLGLRCSSALAAVTAKCPKGRGGARCSSAALGVLFLKKLGFTVYCALPQES